MAYPPRLTLCPALAAGAFACAALVGAVHAQQPSGHAPASATQRQPQPGQPDTDPKVQNVEKSSTGHTAPSDKPERNRKAGDDSGTESRDGRSQPGSTTGAPNNAGMPGAGATSGSGGGADQR